MRTTICFLLVSTAMLPALPPLTIAPGLDRRLAKWKPVEMPFHDAGLSPRERAMVEKLVEACRRIEDIFWRQSDPQALPLYQSLAASTKAEDGKLSRLLRIMGSRFDLLDDERPFVGTGPALPGGGLYPPGLTKAEIESYVARHPEQKTGIYNNYTVIRRRGDALAAIPYREEYRQFLGPAAKALDEAAALSDDLAFAAFLRLRAKALLSDDYFESDLKWLDLANPKFDIILAPYETYLDRVLGVKGSYGGAVLIRNDAESARLSVFQKYVPEIQDALPLAPADRPSKRGHSSPMEVVDAPYRAGDLRHGYQAVADNLPNDPRIHEQKGSKKIFFKNFLDARVSQVILPVAKSMMQPRDAERVTAEGYLAGTLLHEIAHGLGPAYSRRGGKHVDIREAIGPIFSGLEEAKADAVGMFGLAWLADHGAVPKGQVDEYYASYVGGLFRTLRFGTAEAHGSAELMQFDYLLEQKAVERVPASGLYRVEYARMPAAIARLAKELLEIEATGDSARATAWFARYDRLPDEVASAFAKITNVPVDIEPIFSFADNFR